MSKLYTTYQILRLDGDTLSVDGSGIGIFEEGDQVSLSSLLKSHDGRRLEAQISLRKWSGKCKFISECKRMAEGVTDLEVLSDFTNQALEGQLPNQEFSGLLVAPDFTEGDGSGPESVGLLDTAGSGLLPNMEGQQSKTIKKRIPGEQGEHEATKAQQPTIHQLSPKDTMNAIGVLTAEGVFLAALVASCLRGALPIGMKIIVKHPIYPYHRLRRSNLKTYLRWTCEQFAVDGAISCEQRRKCSERVLITLVRAIGIQRCVKSVVLSGGKSKNRFGGAGRVVVAEDEEAEGVGPRSDSCLRFVEGPMASSHGWKLP